MRIALVSFVLITSSGTMALAVNCAYRRDRVNAATLRLVTATFGEFFVAVQGFEWICLIALCAHTHWVACEFVH
ncbi:hypothetical protein [Stenotrophomonas sp. YIM B06876]|uniref:hypothetical protein n=1 Tax=Stenotrophomonas sp. YIM B06876 TaxID=3060211 RepID=UPI00273A4CDE|nr:hypothetical protein [Stenotrophomonas sp. YIM B06876]